MSLITCKNPGGDNSLELRVKSEELGVGGSSSSGRFGSLFSFILSLALLFGVSSAWAEDWEVRENTALTEDKTVGALIVNSGVTLDLNGYKLTCTSLSGSGTITSLATGEDLTMSGGNCAKAAPSGDLYRGRVANLFNNKYSYIQDDESRILLNNKKNNLPLKIDYDFGEGNAYAVSGYKIWAGTKTRAPKAWTLYGSNESSSFGDPSATGWNKIDERSGEDDWIGANTDNLADLRCYTCFNDTAYRYYRLEITDNNGDSSYLELVQLEYFNVPPGELHLNVVSGSSTWPSSIKFVGNVKVVKDGVGTLTASGDLNIYEGAFVIKSGAVTVGGVMRIGYTLGKIAAVDVDGGTLTLNYNSDAGSALVVGDTSTGTLTVNGGTVTVVNKDIYIAYNAGSVGTINLNGGTLFTRRIVTKDGASRTLNFNGGTMKAKSTVQQNGLIAEGVTVNVGENGGTIDSGNLSDATSGSRVFVPADLGQPDDTGSLTLKGGKSINIEGDVNCGVIVELGTTIVASKAILDNGFSIDGRTTLEAKDYDVLVASDLTADDLKNVSLVNCSSGSTVALDDSESPTKIVVSLAAVTGVGMEDPVLVFPSTTLEQIKYAKFTTRMFGKYVAAEYNALGSVDGYNTKLYYDNEVLKSVVVEFQYLESGTTRVRCVVVEFTEGEDGVYAQALGARYQAQASLGYVFLEQDKKTWRGESKTVAISIADMDYGVCDIRWEAINSVWALDSDKNWSDFSGFGSVSPDDVVTIWETGSHTLTIDDDVAIKSIEFANASGSTMSVSSGKKLTAEEIVGIGNILNSGTIEKTGNGTATWPFNNASKGVVIVSGGTLKAASVKTVSGSPYAFVTAENPNANQLVEVQKGASFDLNGVNDLTTSVRLADGAYLVNSCKDIADDKMQTVQIILTGNATATATKQFGLLAPGHKETRLDLGSHTLTLNGSSNFWLDNTTINGDGTIMVESGTLSIVHNDTSGDKCTLVIGEGGRIELADDTMLTVRNFTNRGDAYYGGTGWLTVTGTLTPGSNLKRVALNDGATVKALATASQKILYAFAASGTITIDASAITARQLKESENGIPVLIVPTVYKGGTWAVSNPPISGCRTKWVDNGDNTSTLYLCRSRGTRIIIR